jgi:hypothetical protein
LNIVHCLFDIEHFFSWQENFSSHETLNAKCSMLNEQVLKKWSSKVSMKLTITYFLENFSLALWNATHYCIFPEINAMKQYFTSLLLLLFLSPMLPAQTPTDSISGKYTRHTWTGEGWTNIDYGNGTSAEIAGYTISTSDESLLLDKNHCAALTINTQPGNYGSLFLFSNPVVYYGIWRMSGDTVVITYTKTYSEPFYIIFGSTEPFGGITKMDQPMQRKYLIEDGSLTSLTEGDYVNYPFYKEEENI